MAAGTADEIVRQSGLHTWSVAGDGVGALARALRGAPGVLMATPFGNTLHVAGTDPDALAAAIAPWRDDPGLRWEETRPGLEDVFIQLTRRREAEGVS